ncbi:glycosyltransferase [Candidatus Pelagibacter sp.]|nr:glycosyltransferase [Candidatus Pelagibacter sp.]
MKNIYFWSPCLSKVGTYKSTINSAVSLSKYSKSFYSVKLINVCGEWEDKKKFFKKKDIEVLDLGFNYFRFLPKAGFLKSRFSYLIIILFSIIPLIRLLKKNKSDFFVAHLITSLPLILFYFFNFRSKLILRISGYPKLNLLRKKLWTILSSKIYQCTCPSKDLMFQLKNLNILSDNKLSFLPDPIININDFLKNIRESNNSNIDVPKKKFFMSVGRLTKQKNFEYLINEFSEFSVVNKEFILLIFGTGEQQKYLTNLIEKNKVNTNIFLMGYSKDIYFYMKRAEAFILSSLWEDPGFVIIESALSNLPIISSNCKNGPSEFLQNGRAGILFENNKKGELKKSLDIFMSQKAKMSNKKILAKKNSLNYTLFRHYKLFNKILIE